MPIGSAKNSARRAVFFTFRPGRAGFEPRRADVFYPRHDPLSAASGLPAIPRAAMVTAQLKTGADKR
jgi:hypothetical protein